MATLFPGDLVETVLLAADRGDTEALAQAIGAAGNRKDDLLRCRVVEDSKLSEHLNEGATPLMLAAKAGHVVTVKWLLGNINLRQTSIDADVDVEDWTALYYAVSAGNTEVASLLMAKGANKDHRDSFHGRTMLDVARHRQMFDMFELLTTGTFGKDEGSLGDDDLRRSDREICSAALRRGVMNGVHCKHKEKFLGRYVFIRDMQQCVAEINRFRETLQAPDLFFDVVDILQPNFGVVKLHLTHDGKIHAERLSRATARACTVMRSSSIGTYEFLTIEIASALIQR